MKKIKTTKIGQKDYVDVSERIKHFWELHADWSIITLIEKVDLESGVVIIKAWVEDETGRVRSTGHAHEFQADKKSRVNMTSFVENCETSAIGRALGTLGIGTEHGIASAFEVQLAKEKEAEMNGVIKIVTDAAKKKVEDEVSIADDYASTTTHASAGENPAQSWCSYLFSVSKKQLWKLWKFPQFSTFSESDCGNGNCGNFYFSKTVFFVVFDVFGVFVRCCDHVGLDCAPMWLPELTLRPRKHRETGFFLDERAVQRT